MLMILVCFLMLFCRREVVGIKGAQGREWTVRRDGRWMIFILGSR